MTGPGDSIDTYRVHRAGLQAQTKNILHSQSPDNLDRGRSSRATENKIKRFVDLVLSQQIGINTFIW